LHFHVRYHGRDQLNKGKLLNKPEHEMLSKFISGLPEQMSFFIRARLPQDMETALTAAKIEVFYVLT
jgi:hypothetical protein